MTDTKQSRLTATLLCVTPPDEHQEQGIRAFLQKKYGEDVALTIQQDASLKSGFQLHVGSEVYDWSAKGRMEQFRQQVEQLVAKNTRKDIIPLLRSSIDEFRLLAKSSEVGTVKSIGDGIAVVEGLEHAAYGEILMFDNGIKGMVQDLRRNETGCILFDNADDISAGSKVARTGKTAGVPVGDAFLGRVVDALGRPIDGGDAIPADGYRPVEEPAPGIIDRQSVDTPMETGLLSIDAMFPIGRGQRELIIGDRQTGKTAIALDAMLNQKGKNVICVYVAIGQKASSVAQLVENLRKRDAMDYCVVVSATAGEADTMQYIAPYAGCAMAEYYMHKGRDVLIVYDDLSKHAIACRAMSLLLERAPLELVRGLGIAMDSNWKPMFVLEGDTARADACLIRPYNAAVEDPSLGWENAGYWAAPHTLSGDNIRLISYSVPLIAPDGTVYGVLGVDILEDYLLRLLPYDELSEDHGSAYILGVRGAAAPEASVRPQVVSGPVYLAASGFSTVYLEKESAGLYTLERGGGEEMYVCSAVLNLYNTNTPFADDQWVLLGAVPGRTLFALKHDTLLIMLALLASIVLTSLVTILITVRSVSQPIVKLAAEVRATDPAAPARLQKTDITELDALAGSIETLSDEVLRAGGKFTQILEMASVRMGGFEVDGRDGTLFLTDQFFDVFGRPELASTVRGPQSFERAMDALHVYVTEREKTDDEHTEYIFRMPEPDGVRWVRMRLLRSSSRWTGLAEDITSDRMSLERMEYERDHDVLTELYNRRAFKRMALALLARGPQAACVGALVMLDLDNLKYINDTYGHDMGDAYIRCMAASLPSPDGERCLVARMSGDEFFVLFHGYDTQEEVRGQIALLRQRMTRASLTLPDGVRQSILAALK